ncbi:MAG TPA: XrtA system polysaccharide deacetylase [Candidatus Sulfotelmatobacter sp.]|nr:XrtA system polysaccharide deacetylase [Candidatus Sulfotelmatobacter sp.]
MATAEIARSPGATETAPVNGFSVDVEDHFQVEALKPVVDRGSWESRPGRVEASTERILAILDGAKVHATFFILGWVAERYPGLVRLITACGHEIASHGYGHESAFCQPPAEFCQDVRRAKQILEDCAGCRVTGYRAPTFSIGRQNWWAYDVLASEGYSYSSSIYPIAHDLYGLPEAPRTPFRPASGDFLEIPVATMRLLGRSLPCGGGGYFRLLPYTVSRWCLTRVVRDEQMPCVFYCHPWEFDPDQPRFRNAPLKSQFRHYLNLGAMEHRIARLLRDFHWDRLDAIFFDSRGAPKATIRWAR